METGKERLEMTTEDQKQVAGGDFFPISPFGQSDTATTCPYCFKPFETPIEMEMHRVTCPISPIFKAKKRTGG